jgi:hypothetical protein
MAIGDVIENCEGLSPDRVAAVDAMLEAEGIMTLTAVRARFWARVQQILRRGTVRGERDYYALRNVVEGLAEEEQSRAWQILASFEAHTVGKAQ